jgi:hypothetical protein
MLSISRAIGIISFTVFRDNAFADDFIYSNFAALFWNRELLGCLIYLVEV